jgi:hypothetical protein
MKAKLVKGIIVKDFPTHPFRRDNCKVKSVLMLHTSYPGEFVERPIASPKRQESAKESNSFCNETLELGITSRA